MEWRDVCVGVPTNIIWPTTMSTHHNFNCLRHLICALWTTTYNQNIIKLLTSSSILDYIFKTKNIYFVIWLKFKIYQITILSFVHGTSAIGIMARVMPMVWETRVQSQVKSYQTQKVVLDSSLLNTQHYKVWIKGKCSNPGKGIVPSYTPWYSTYWKGSL